MIQRLEKKMLDCQSTLALQMIDVNGLANSNNSIKEMFVYFEDKSHKSKGYLKNLKHLHQN